MRHRIYITIFFFLCTVSVFGQQPDKKPLRIVDTLTVQDRSARNPIILRSELDSLIKIYQVIPVKEPVIEPVKGSETKANLDILASGLVIILLMLGWLLYQFYSHRKKFSRTFAGFNQQLKELEPNNLAKEKMVKSKTSHANLETRISELNDELHKLKKENENLGRVLKEYNGIQHEYDSLKHGLTKAYKVKNYPGYEKTKADTVLLQGVLETENSVANYAYEKFLKPILAISDANKNNPARISEEDRVKVLDLLISLSFLYIEYLYLRVNDLSIGGKMVERIDGLQRGNGLDPSLLKKLNLEHGSRALVLRMILDKSDLQHLSYPVFDETNLNNL